jgi:hypothetical protein
MPFKRYAARVDNNQPAMVEDLRAMGFSVYPTHRVGQGFPDLCISRGGITMLCEVKQGRGKLTKDEAEFHASWQGQIVIAYTAEDVLRAFERGL